jgi:enamine deaminase RidA (YjgF/YER057c/UK114 family)
MSMAGRIWADGDVAAESLAVGLRRVVATDVNGELAMPNNTVKADGRLRELHIELPHPPAPLGAYVEAVQAGNLLFLSGTLPVDGGVPKFLGRIGAELSVEQGRRATRLAALNALALVKEHLGSLDKVRRVVRLGISLATAADFREHPKVADAASDLLVSVFGADKTSTRLVLGMASLPLGVCVVLESIFEVGE